MYSIVAGLIRKFVELCYVLLPLVAFILVVVEFVDRWMMVMVVTGYKGSFLSLQGFLPLHRREYRMDFPAVSGVNPQYFCCWCGKASTTRYDYEKHHRTHTGEKPFNCHICPFRTGDRSSLSKHVRRHHHPNPPSKQGHAFSHHH